jgi:hypothetical protein
MVNIFKFTAFNKLLLSGILVTFSMAVVNPCPAYTQINIGLNDVTFALKIKDLVEKVWKYKDKRDTNRHIRD